jgi:hypothetical protein
MKCYSPTGRRNHGRPLKRLLDTWDRNGSTSGPTPWQTDDYDDDNDDDVQMKVVSTQYSLVPFLLWNTLNFLEFWYSLSDTDRIPDDQNAWLIDWFIFGFDPWSSRCT